MWYLIAFVVGAVVAYAICYFTKVRPDQGRAIGNATKKVATAAENEISKLRK